MDDSSGRSESGTRPTSERKVEANRRNAEKSTGPRTAEGKRRSSLNATKHGIFSSVAVIHGGEGEEDAERFGDVLEGLREDLAPAGELEEMLVEKLAVIAWRQRRVYRFEVGSIKEQADAPFQRWQVDLLMKASEAPVSQASARARIENLQDVITEVLQEDPLRAPSPELLRQLVYLTESEAWDPKALGVEMWIDDAPATVEEFRELFEAFRQSKSMTVRDAWRWVAEYCERQIVDEERLIESLDAKAEHLGMLSGMPDDERERKILRYEAHISREFSRTLDQLLKLKLGEEV